MDLELRCLSRSLSLVSLGLLQMSLLGFGFGIAHAEPLDLFNGQPRMILVAFEISPQDRPEQTDFTYSHRFPAWIEPGERESELRVRIDAEIVESHLIPEQNPVLGSFSDFVWTFDVATGHVISATMFGTVVRTLNWGLVKTRTNADIAVAMTTAQESGFREPTRLLGQQIFKHCTQTADEDCTLVSPTPFEADTGYVNAVGHLRVLSSMLELSSFSPLGEAIFSELEAEVEPIFRDYEALAGDPASGNGPDDLEHRIDSNLNDVGDIIEASFDIN
jgi:hypothetical protein